MPLLTANVQTAVLATSSALFVCFQSLCFFVHFFSLFLPHFPTVVQLGAVSQSSGSAYVELGETKVICSVFASFIQTAAHK